MLTSSHLRLAGIQRIPLSVLLAYVAAVLAVTGCTGSPVNTAPAEPPVGQDARPAAMEADLPPDLLPVFPNGYAFSVGRFVSRTLETSPDGESRRWPTTDPSVILVIRADSTEIVDETICRRATIIVESPSAGTQRFAYRACRRATGMWAPR
jgi:hypothetical protein